MHWAQRAVTLLSPPRGMIRQFTPNWFAATMGTGVLALVLPQIPLAGPMLEQAGEGLWLFNIGLFALFSSLYAARWAFFGHEARRIFSHSVVSMFIATIPMGLATIINGCIVFGEPRWGHAMILLAQALWWIDVAMAVGCGVLIPYWMFTRHEHTLDQMTAIWLLPFVAAGVAAVSGGLLAPYLDGAHSRLLTLVVSYALWAYSIPAAFCILTILILRMVLHKLPHESMAASSWLALGPLGTGSLGMIILGGQAPALFEAHGLAWVGTMAAGLGVILGTLLWGFGLWWLLLASIITVRYFRAGVPFNLGWWGYTFPLGVYTLATLKLGATLHLGFFPAFGAVQAAALATIWIFVSAKTIYGGWKGHLFVSPCIGKAN